MADILPWKERKLKAAKYLKNSDRCLCIGAGGLLYYVLRQYGVSDFELHENLYGKPELKEDQNLKFNLSHSGNYIVCAVGDAQVGIDVENSKKDNFDIAEKWFAEKEYQWLSETKDRQEGFNRLWTLKESYIKMRGMGLSIPLDSFCIIPGEIMSKSPNDNGFTKFLMKKDTKVITLKKEEQMEHLYFREFGLPGHHVSVCAETDISTQMNRVQVSQIISSSHIK